MLTYSRLFLFARRRGGLESDRIAKQCGGLDRQLRPLTRDATTATASSPSARAASASSLVAQALMPAMTNPTGYRRARRHTHDQAGRGFRLRPNGRFHAA